jgi:hypothetical protein
MNHCQGIPITVGQLIQPIPEISIDIERKFLGHRRIVPGAVEGESCLGLDLMPVRTDPATGSTKACGPNAAQLHYLQAVIHILGGGPLWQFCKLFVNPSVQPDVVTTGQDRLDDVSIMECAPAFDEKGRAQVICLEQA